jgi:hypothetical protein
MCTPGFHLCRLYPGELNFGQTIWDKNQVLLGTSWGIWEHLGNKGEKKQKILVPPTPLKKKKNWIVHECMLSLSIGCMKILFSKLLVTIFGLG